MTQNIGTVSVKMTFKGNEYDTDIDLAGFEGISPGALMVAAIRSITGALSRIEGCGCEGCAAVARIAVDVEAVLARETPQVSGKVH